jgi:hypothetical protein
MALLTAHEIEDAAAGWKQLAIELGHRGDS